MIQVTQVTLVIHVIFQSRRDGLHSVEILMKIDALQSQIQNIEVEQEQPQHVQSW